LNPRPCAIDLRRLVRSAVFPQDAIVEMFDTQAKSGDADFSQGMNLGFRKRARLALERYLFGRVPGNIRSQPLDQPLELPRAQERRRAAAEVHKSKGPPAHGWQLADKFNLARKSSQVTLDLRRVLFRKNLEVTKFAPL